MYVQGVLCVQVGVQISFFQISKDLLIEAYSHISALILNELPMGACNCNGNTPKLELPHKYNQQQCHLYICSMSIGCIAQLGLRAVFLIFLLATTVETGQGVWNGMKNMGYEAE